MTMSMKSVVAMVLLVAAAPIFFQAGCDEDRPTSSSASNEPEARAPGNELETGEPDNGTEVMEADRPVSQAEPDSGAEAMEADRPVSEAEPDRESGVTEADWPVSAAPPDSGPRDLLRRCHNSQRDGNVREYLACYRGNDPAYRDVMAESFKLAEAHLELERVLTEHYGRGSWQRFKELDSFVSPQDLDGPDWATSGTMKWDGVSDEALWYEYDVPEEDQLPRRLSLVDEHWCFAMRENSTSVDVIVKMMSECVGKTEAATEAARQGPAVYTLEQVRDVYDSYEP